MDDAVSCLGAIKRAPRGHLHRSLPVPVLGLADAVELVRFERHCGVMGDPSSHVCARSVGLWAGGTRVLYLQPATLDRLGLRPARWSTEVPVIWNFGRARGWASCWSPLTAFHANRHAKTGPCEIPLAPLGCQAWLVDTGQTNRLSGPQGAR